MFAYVIKPYFQYIYIFPNKIQFPKNIPKFQIIVEIKSRGRRETENEKE